MQPLTVPEFSRPLTPEALERSEGETLAAEADTAERAALAERFGVPAVLSLGYRARATRWGRDGWRIVGQAEARLEQTCVVTLEPVETVVTEPFDRRFVPESALDRPSPGGELELDSAMVDGPDGFSGSIDLGEIAAEAVALGIDPYPRREGAEVGRVLSGPKGAEPLTDEAARPFAGLAALRRRDGEG